VSHEALPRSPPRRKVRLMKRRFPSRTLPTLCSLFFSVLSVICFVVAVDPKPLAAQPPAAVSAFNTYVATLDSRLAHQHRSPTAFLAPEDDSCLRRGDLVIEQLTPPAVPGALLHHWRGTAFAPGATGADFERFMRDFPSYPRHFAPQVLQASILTQHGDTLQTTMRVRQHHILTVVLDTAYDVTFARLDATHGYSLSRSTHISELDSEGHATEDHGFLWRQNIYWSYEERDDGLYLQIESVSLSRAIPRGLAWAVLPFVESVPRDSLDFTLRSTSNALKR
jgi:hypothetical protein